MSTLKNKPLVGKIKMRSDGEFDFSGHNVKVVEKVDENGKRYKDIEFDNPQARSIQFSGNIDRYKDLQTTLSAIEFVTNCNITFTKTTIRIR